MRVGVKAGPFWVASGESRGSGCAFFVAIVLGLAALGFVILHWQVILIVLASIVGLAAAVAAIGYGYQHAQLRR